MHFKLTSSGVMNSFFVPQLGSQIYTMAGMTSQLSLQADQAGVFHGISAQFSGAGFADMHFDVRAVSADAYATWIGDAKASAGGALDAGAYAQLAKPGETPTPTTYPAVDPGLFKSIVDQTALDSPKAPSGADARHAPPPSRSR